MTINVLHLKQHKMKKKNIFLYFYCFIALNFFYIHFSCVVPRFNRICDDVKKGSFFVLNFIIIPFSIMALIPTSQTLYIAFVLKIKKSLFGRKNIFLVWHQNSKVITTDQTYKIHKHNMLLNSIKQSDNLKDVRRSYLILFDSFRCSNIFGCQVC